MVSLTQVWFVFFVSRISQTEIIWHQTWGVLIIFVKLHFSFLDFFNGWKLTFLVAKVSYNWILPAKTSRLRKSSISVLIHPKMCLREWSRGLVIIAHWTNSSFFVASRSNRREPWTEESHLGSNLVYDAPIS